MVIQCFGAQPGHATGRQSGSGEDSSVFVFGSEARLLEGYRISAFKSSTRMASGENRLLSLP